MEANNDSTKVDCNMLPDKTAIMAALFAGQGNNPFPNNEASEGATILRIPPQQLVEFHSNKLGRQPYQVRENADFAKLVESVAQRGVFEPIIVRPDTDNKEMYEIISGHRRHLAALKANIREVPVLVESLDDSEANIRVCDANLHREDILPSEKAWAYRLKLEAMKQQGKRTDLESGTSAQIEQKSKGKTSIERLSEDSEDGRAQIQRYIRLTHLLPELLEMVDRKQLKFMVGVELSYLKEHEQTSLLHVMEENDGHTKPTLEQAQKLKQLSKEKTGLSKDMIYGLLQCEKKASGMNASFINGILPTDIRKMSVERRKAYTSRAFEVYAAYLSNHPEEESNWRRSSD